MSYYQPNVLTNSLKIVGGNEAIPHSWPSIALLYFYYNFDYSIDDVQYTDFFVQKCGGTLISNTQILTAAQ